MDKGTALIYELTIRAIYNNCKRLDIEAADADIYRDLVMSEKEERPTLLREIKQYLTDAIQHMDKSAFDQTQNDKVQHIHALLNQPTIDKVTEAIEVLDTLVFDKN